MKPIRKSYEELGVNAFYSSQGQDYSNPHEAQIKTLIHQNQHRIDYSNVLDFCCGSGEVTMALRELGYQNITGSDPYTRAAYGKRTNQQALKISFNDVIKKGLFQQYTAVISSFAMHLCPEEKLYPLTLQIFQSTPLLIILTPHKRPQLEQLDGVNLAFEDFTLTPRGKKIRLKAYEYGY